MSMSDAIRERSPLTTYGLLSLRRRWRLIVASGISLLILALAFVALRPAQYTSTAQLLVFVRKLSPGPDPVVVAGDADVVQVQNEIEIIRSRGMLTKTAQALNLADDNEIVPTPLFKAPAAPDVRLERAVDYLRKNVALQTVGASHTILVRVTTSDPHESERIANAIADGAVQTRFSAEQQHVRSPLLRERVQGLGPSAYVITTAEPPSYRDGPKKIQILAAAATLGLVFGAALALLLDLLDRTVRTAAQIEHFGLECIGAIPELRSRTQWPPSERTSPGGGRPDAMLDQTIRRTLAAIEAAQARTIGVTTPIGGEGATTVAVHLARMANARGVKALLVQPDWSDLSLGDGGGADDAVWSRRVGPDALASHDLVLVDLPPLERGAEFRLAARNIGGLLLVVKWGDTQFDEMERAMAESGVPLSEFIGAVLNMVDERMIGKFGDKLWEAEAGLAAGRRPFEFPTPA
jgi:capsular polysaccharide biosynthesis protein